MVKEAKGNESNQGTSLDVLNLGFLTFFFETQMNGRGGGGDWHPPFVVSYHAGAIRKCYLGEEARG